MKANENTVNRTHLIIISSFTKLISPVIEKLSEYMSTKTRLDNKGEWEMRCRVVYFACLQCD